MLPVEGGLLGGMVAALVARHRPVLHATAFGAIAFVLELLYYRYDWRSLTLDPLYAAQAMVSPAARACPLRHDTEERMLVIGGLDGALYGFTIER